MDNLKEHKPRALSRLGQSGSIFGIEAVLQKKKNDIPIFLLSADYSVPAGMTRFIKSFPDAFVNVGIAEQNLIGVAAGIQSEKNVAVASAQSCFISMRALEPVRQYMGYMGIPLVLVGVSAGFALTFFGNTHFALEDIGLFDCIDNVCIYSPSDGLSAISVFRSAISLGKPCYIRCTGSTDTQVIYEKLDEINSDYNILNDGSKTVVISTGVLTGTVANVIADLKTDGHNLGHVDLLQLKPFPYKIFEYLGRFDNVITFEEHSERTGLGSILKRESISVGFDTSKIKSMGTGSQSYKAGDYDYLMRSAGLDYDSIKKKLLVNI